MLELFWAELKRTWTEFIRYPLDSLMGVIFTTLMFYGLLLSARYMAGPSLQFGERLDAIVVGYVLWILVIFAADNIAFTLQIEAQTGTLEQIFLSPFGAVRVFLIRAMASLTLHLVLTLGSLVVVVVLTGRQLSFPLSLFLPLIAVLLGAYGIGFMLGALALLFKRIQQVLGLSQFGLLFLLMIPSETWIGALQSLRFLLPMTLGAGMLRDLMARNQSLNFFECALAAVNGLGYFVVGLLIFRWAESKAKAQGMLGGY